MSEEKVLFEHSDGHCGVSLSTMPSLVDGVYSLGMQDGGGFMSCWVSLETLQKLAQAINALKGSRHAD